MRIAGYNILKGAVGREGRVAEVLRALDADIIILEEAARPETVKTIARILNYPYSGGHKRYSTAFISRLQPDSFRWHKHLLLRSPVLEFAPMGSTVRVFGVHLYAFPLQMMESLRRWEIGHILKLTAPHRDTPHVILGDFNTLAADDSFDRSTYPGYLKAVLALNGGRIPRRAIPRLQAAGYVDCFRRLHPDDPGYSLPAANPNTRLDYAFVPEHTYPKVTQCRIIREPAAAVSIASDHCPVLIELDV